MFPGCWTGMIYTLRRFKCYYSLQRKIFMAGKTPPRFELQSSFSRGSSLPFPAHLPPLGCVWDCRRTHAGASSAPSGPAVDNRKDTAVTALAPSRFGSSPTGELLRAPLRGAAVRRRSPAPPRALPGRGLLRAVPCHGNALPLPGGIPRQGRAAPLRPQARGPCGRDKGSYPDGAGPSQEGPPGARPPREAWQNHPPGRSAGQRWVSCGGSK